MVAIRQFFAVSIVISTVLTVHLVATRPIMLSSIAAVSFVRVSISCSLRAVKRYLLAVLLQEFGEHELV